MEVATTPTVGAVGQLAAKRRTERGTGPMSKRRLAPTAQAGTVRTPGEKAALGLERRQERSRGTGFGATTITGKRIQAQHGIAASTEMNWKDKLYERVVSRLTEGGKGMMARRRKRRKAEAAKVTGKTRKFKSGEYQGNTFSADRPQGKRRTSTDTDETDTGRQGPKLPTRLQAKLRAYKARIPTSHPSSTQERMRKELGKKAYEKLSTRPGDLSPVEAAKAKREKSKGSQAP